MHQDYSISLAPYCTTYVVPCMQQWSRCQLLCYTGHNTNRSREHVQLRAPTMPPSFSFKSRRHACAIPSLGSKASHHVLQHRNSHCFMTLLRHDSVAAFKTVSLQDEIYRLATNLLRRICSAVFMASSSCLHGLACCTKPCERKHCAWLRESPS